MLRGEAFDWVIPITENHLRRVVNLGRVHYNRGLPHMAIGPGISEPPAHLPLCPRLTRHEFPLGLHVISRPVLGGLHHEYAVAPKAA